MERRDRLVNDATADRLRRRRDQEARSLETVRVAGAESYEKVRQAEARRFDFLVRYAARSRLGLGEELALLAEAVTAQVNGKGPAEAREGYTRARRERLGRQRALSDFRLYWDTLAGSLGGRAKVLVDAEKLPGRRLLWLTPGGPLPAVPALPRGGEGRKGEP